MRKTYFQTLDESSLVFDVWTFQLFVRVPLLWMFASSGDGGVESLIKILLPCQVNTGGRFQVSGKAMYFQALRFKITAVGKVS